ncbi:hypothetical protein D3C73_1440830 [compost metagenome]
MSGRSSEAMSKLRYSVGSEPGGVVMSLYSTPVFSATYFTWGLLLSGMVPTPIWLLNTFT